MCIRDRIVGGSEFTLCGFESDRRRDGADAGLFLNEETIIVFGDRFGKFIGNTRGERLAHQDIHFVAENGFVECGIVLTADSARFDAAILDIL